MKTYRKVMDFMANHLLLVLLSIVMSFLVILFCIDRQSIMLNRAIIVSILWIVLFIYDIAVEFKKHKKQ